MVRRHVEMEVVLVIGMGRTEQGTKYVAFDQRLRERA